MPPAELPLPRPNQRDLSPLPGSAGEVEGRKAPDPVLTDAELLVDIAENLLPNENTQPQKFQRQDDEGNRIPTASAGVRCGKLRRSWCLPLYTWAGRRGGQTGGRQSPRTCGVRRAVTVNVE